jgi:hypothetical protein
MGVQDGLGEISEIRTAIATWPKISIAGRRSMAGKRRNGGQYEPLFLSSKEKDRILFAGGRPGKVFLLGFWFVRDYSPANCRFAHSSKSFYL